MKQLEANQGRSAKSVFSKIKSSNEFMILFIVLLFSVIVSIKSRVFLSVNNLRTTALGLSTNGIVAIGVTIALIGGCFDLSVGALTGLAAVATVFFGRYGLSSWAAALIAFLICVAIGIINGILVGKLRLNGFITTFAVSQIARGAVFVLTKGYSLNFPTQNDSFQAFGNARLLGVPVIVIIFAVLIIVSHFLLRKSSILRKVFYVGSNESAAVLSGINSSNVKMALYILSASLAALAGVLTAARFGVATATIGDGLEMQAISAVVIGGTSLAGGQGTILGTVLGVVLLSIINNTLVLFRVSIHWQNLIAGGILMAAILVDFFGRKRT